MLDLRCPTSDQKVEWYIVAKPQGWNKFARFYIGKRKNRGLAKSRSANSCSSNGNILCDPSWLETTPFVVARYLEVKVMLHLIDL